MQGGDVEERMQEIYHARGREGEVITRARASRRLDSRSPPSRSPPSPQRSTFQSRVEAVRVDVLVTDGGRPVPGLGPADFEVLDSGVAQQIDLVDPIEMPLNVVFVFDLSASVAGEPLDRT